MKKLFILIKHNMPLAYQGVQGTHGAVQWILDNPNQTWNNQTLVMLEAENLDQWMFKLDTMGIKYSKFIEPDKGYIVTSIAILGHDKLFKKLKLIGWREANQIQAKKELMTTC